MCSETLDFSCSTVIEEVIHLKALALDIKRCVIETCTVSSNVNMQCRRFTAQHNTIIDDSILSKNPGNMHSFHSGLTCDIDISSSRSFLFRLKTH